MTSGIMVSRIRRSRQPVLLLLVGVMVGIVPELHAQESTMLDAGVRVASFEDAQRLASDGFGYLYVVDRGTGRLVRLSPDGGDPEYIGGSGSPLSDAAGVDPTNGLLIFVSNRSAGNIMRFSRDLLPRGVIGDTRFSDRRWRDVPVEQRHDVNMQPTDLAVSREGDVFVIDRQQRTVLKFDALYHVERRIGEFGSGRGNLSDPILLTLSLDGNQLYVVDADGYHVFVYDLNGSFLRRIVLPDDREIVSIRETRRGLVVLHADGASVLRDGEWNGWAVPGSIGPLTDALITDDALYLLTKRWLYRTVIPVPDD